MSTTRRKFSEKEKIKHVVGYERSADKTAYANEHQIRRSVINHWRKKFDWAIPRTLQKSGGQAKHRTRYSLEEKQQHLVAATTYPGGAIAYGKHVGIHPSTLYNWRRTVETRARPSTARNGTPHTSHNEIDELKQQLAMLRALLATAVRRGFTLTDVIDDLFKSPPAG